jgi:hypothetical protein
MIYLYWSALLCMAIIANKLYICLLERKARGTKYVHSDVATLAAQQPLCLLYMPISYQNVMGCPAFHGA